MEEKFQKGDISTNYLPQVYPEGFRGKLSFRNTPDVIIKIE